MCMENSEETSQKQCCGGKVKGLHQKHKLRKHMLRGKFFRGPK